MRLIIWSDIEGYLVAKHYNIQFITYQRFFTIISITLFKLSKVSRIGTFSIDKYFWLKSKLSTHTPGC